MKKTIRQQGFTLIELMIVVAILAILAAIAFSAYHQYVIKSRVSAAISELAPAKVGVESRLAAGESFAAARDIGMLPLTSHCRISISGFAVLDEGGGAIVCDLLGSTYLDGESITISRIADTSPAALLPGSWSCATTVEMRFTSKECPGV